MKKYVELIQLLEEIFGKGSVSRTIGTRTNVVRFPKGKQPIDPTKAELNIEGTAVNNPDLVQTIKNSIEDRMGDITKMNDQELLTYTANVRRLKNFENPPKLPEADVVKFGSGEEMKGKGLEQLIEKQGTRFPPTTDIGKIEAFGKKLEKFVEETSPEFLAKQEAERKAMIARQYEGKGYAGGVFGPSGEYRAVARTFLLDQNAKGKIKLDANTLKNLEERNYLSGGQPLMYADPIRIMRYHYGDDVFEKIPLDKITTGARSEILDVMSKVEAPPIKTEAPKTPGGYLTPGEYKANIEELKQVEDAIRRRESRFADMTEEEIQNELAQYGGKRSSFEMGLEFDYPEEYAKYKVPKKPEPSKRGEVVSIVSEADKRKTIDELIDEYNTNFDRTLLMDEEGGTKVGYQEFQDLQKRNEEIAKALEEKGIKSTVEEEVKPEGIVIPFRKKFTKPEPEEKADGGIIGYANNRSNYFFGGFIRPLMTRFKDAIKGIVSPVQPTPSTPEIPLTLTERYQKYLSQATPGASDDFYNQYKKNLESKADGGRIGYNKGKRVMSSIDKLLEDLNKKLSKKKSMETVNPKTGEVTVPKKPIRKAEEPTGITTMDPEPDIVNERAITKTKQQPKSRQLTDDEIADYEERIGRNSEEWMSEGTVDEAEKALKRSKAEEAYYRGQYLTGKLDPVAGEQTQARMNFLQKKLEEAEMTKDRRLISPREIQELDELEKIFVWKKGDPLTEENFASSPFAPSQQTLDNLEKAREMTKGMSLEEEMNMVLNQYDKSMFIKNEQGMVDVTNPQNVEKMALLLKRDHPELYGRLEAQIQPNILEDFDVTGRKPNSEGGIAGLL